MSGKAFVCGCPRACLVHLLQLAGSQFKSLPPSCRSIDGMKANQRPRSCWGSLASLLPCCRGTDGEKAVLQAVDAALARADQEEPAFMPEKKRKGQVAGQEGPELQHSAFVAARAAIKGEQLVNAHFGTAQLKAAGRRPARGTVLCLGTGQAALKGRGCWVMNTHLHGLEQCKRLAVLGIICCCWHLWLERMSRGLGAQSIVFCTSAALTGSAPCSQMSRRTAFAALQLK